MRKKHTHTHNYTAQHKKKKQKFELTADESKNQAGEKQTKLLVLIDFFFSEIKILKTISS